jgi:hypothetical protein
MEQSLKATLSLVRECNGGIILIGRKNGSEEWLYLNFDDFWHHFDDPE